MTTTAEVIPAVVDAFAAAAVTTFQELCGIAVTLLGTTEASAAIPPADIFAAIPLRRDPEWLLICGFPSAVLELFTSRYLPRGQELSRDLLDDAAGEFANVIAGQTKTLLKGTPHHFSLSTPTVSTRRSDVWPGHGGGIEMHFGNESIHFWFWIVAFVRAEADRSGHR